MIGNNGSPSMTAEQIRAAELLVDIPEFAEVIRQLSERALKNEPEPGDPWKAYTLADAYQERPPLEYIAGKVFQLPSLSVVYGAPGTLKSLLLQDLCVCVAADLAWLTPAPWQPGTNGGGLATKQTTVMWIDFDNGSRRTLNRFEALGRARNLPTDLHLVFYSMPAPWLAATNPESIDQLAERIKRAGAQLVVIDNLGNVSGDADENSAEMGTVMAQFRRIAEETGAAIILIHHQRKSSGEKTRAGDALRGHSSIEAALDLALLVEREDYSDTINIRATKVRGADVLPFSAVFTFEDKPGTDELHTARFYGIEAEDTKSNAAIDRAIIAQLATMGEVNKTTLAEAAKKALADVGINRIRNRIDFLASEKGNHQLKTKPGKVTNEVVYYL